MILNLFVDVDIEENEQIDIELIDLHSGIVKISGVGVKPCKLLESSQNKSMLISECGFSHELNKFLIDNDIHNLYELHNINYHKMREMIFSFSNCKVKCGEHINIMCNIMKKYNISFKDIAITELIPIEECAISSRAQKALIKTGIVFLQDVAAYSKDDIGKIRNFGIKSRTELEDVMKKYGYSYLRSDTPK